MDIQSNMSNNSANPLSSIQLTALAVVTGLLLFRTDTGQNFKEKYFGGSTVAVTKLEISKPTPQILEFVTPVVEVLSSVDLQSNGVLESRVIELRDFYYIFSSSVERNEEYFLNSEDFRKYNQVTLRLAYRNTEKIIDPPPLEEAIDSSLQNVISLEPAAELDTKEVSKVLLGIAWAFNEKLKG